MTADLSRRRDNLVILLAVNSGATDAIGFLALGGAFTSVMTGNMVLTGLGLASRNFELATLTAIAIISFIAGCALGARVAGRPQPSDGTWPRKVTTALSVQGALTLVYAVAWVAANGTPDSSLRMTLLAVNAVGLGIQSSAVQRFGEGGLSTTYLTGTLTTLVVHLATGGSLKRLRRSALLLLGLIAGAAAGAAMIEHARLWAPVIQVSSLAVVFFRARKLHASADRTLTASEHRRQ